MIRAVLFDLDGTLLDSEPDFTAVLNAMLATQARPEVSMQEVRETVSDGARALLRLVSDEPEDSPGFIAMQQAFLDAYALRLEAGPSGQPFSGMSALLAELEARGLLWGIVTNKSTRFTHLLQRKLPLLARSQVTVCADEVAQGKPAPDSLLLAAERLSCPATDILYVGDHPRDIEAGQAAGMLTAAATWGYLPPQPAPGQWGADVIVATPNDLIAVLDAAMEAPS